MPLRIIDDRSNKPCMSQPLQTRRRGRPPKSLDGFSATREALVRAGVIALTEKGFSSTGIEDVLQAVGVPKGSFYHYFESKEAFGAELINRYADYFAKRLDRFFLNAGQRPIERLRDFIVDAEASMRRHQYKRGCLVGNLGQEMGSLPEAYRRQLRSVFVDWQQRTAACLQAAKNAGEISRTADCVFLAQFFWIGWEGAVLRAKLERSPLALRTFSDGFFAMIRR